MSKVNQPERSLRATGGEVVGAENQAVPIITYHGVSDLPYPLFTPPAAFEAQLAALAEAGYRTVTLSMVVDYLRGRAALPQKPLVITFDDGYQSVFSEAFPRMKKFGFTGTIFVITDRCGDTNQWAGQPGWVPSRPLMSWDQLAELGGAGWELNPHTRAHLPLPLLSPERIEDELAGSQEAVRRHTGQPADIFSQPYGATDQTVDDLVRCYFSGAVGVKPGLVGRGSDPFHLARIDSYYLKPGHIPHLGTSRYRGYLTLLRLGRAVRRWGRTDWQLQDNLEGRI